MTIDVDLTHRFPGFELDARFQSEGAVTALFGSSGSGKSTIVNIIGGLIRPNRGYVRVGGETLVDTARGIFIPAHRRKIGYVFQEGRLFPHMTVRQNLLYGQFFSRMRPAASLDAVVSLLGLENLLSRQPRTLSGGEQQRVAIGRALLAAPQLILMDEPLASLDDKRKQEILPYLERLRDESRIPIIYVSHSAREILRLATETVILSHGKVVAYGPTLKLMQRLDIIPLTGESDAAAVLEASVVAHDEATRLTHLEAASGRWRIPLISRPTGSKLRMQVSSTDVLLSASEPGSLSALNIFPCIVEEVAFPASGIAIIRLNCNGDVLIAQLTRYSQEALGAKPGRALFAIVKSVAVQGVDAF